MKIPKTLQFRSHVVQGSVRLVERSRIYAERSRSNQPHTAGLRLRSVLILCNFLIQLGF